jgi:hypothetical protein
MGRKFGFVAAAAAIFAAVIVVMLNLMQGPLKDSDYLVVGTVATVAAMLVLFVLLIATSGKKANVFFKRRKKS